MGKKCCCPGEPAHASIAPFHIQCLSMYFSKPSVFGLHPHHPSQHGPLVPWTTKEVSIVWAGLSEQGSSGTVAGDSTNTSGRLMTAKLCQNCQGFQLGKTSGGRLGSLTFSFKRLVRYLSLGSSRSYVVSLKVLRQIHLNLQGNW